MAKQYWVGELYVDVSRNQISQQGQSQTLPPKALQVLTCLAKNQGQVVSYETLFDEVWPDSVVTPNTLQRSIAQLRKALDGNSPLVESIKTHAKQGYSLDATVDWSPVAQTTDDAPLTHSTEVLAEDADTAETPEQPSPALKNYYSLSILGIIVVLLVATVGWQLNRGNPARPAMQFSDLRYITATDDKEYGAQYSSDGRYILFNRFYNRLCMSNIWAKNRETLQEVQLTNELGTYGGHSLSPDGKTLVFIKQGDCTQPAPQETCYRLMSINFHQALTAPQTATELLNCQNSSISRPVWVDAEHIVMQQRSHQRWRMISFSVATGTSTVLYEVPDGHVSSFAWSAQQQRFAVSAFKGDGGQYIDMLDAEGQQLSSHPVQLPENSPKYLKISPQFTPTKGELIFSFESELFILSETGAVRKVRFPFDTSVDTAYFHPNGDRLLLVKGGFDTDINALSLADVSSIGKLDSRLETTTIARSTATEDQGKFHPKTSHIAYASAQTGSQQVWLLTPQGNKVLSQLPNGSFIQNMIWSADAQQLLVYANWQLHLLTIGAQTTHLEFPHLLTDLFHWDSAQQQAIANILQKGRRQLVRIDLDTLTFTTINNQSVAWAVNTPQDGLIYMDDQHQFWRPGAIEDKRIDALSGQGSPRRFVIQNRVIYGINNDHQLWSYHLGTQTFTHLAQVDPNTNYLTDIRGQQLLLTVDIDTKKEVIELSLVP